MVIKQRSKVNMCQGIYIFASTLILACLPSPSPSAKSSINDGAVQPPQLPVHDHHHGRHEILLQATAGHLLQEDSR